MNKSHVLANRIIGRGYTTARKYNSILGLTPPVRKRIWKNKELGILQASTEALKSSMDDARRTLKAVLGKGNNCVLNITCSFDASWTQRG